MTRGRVAALAATAAAVAMVASSLPRAAITLPATKAIPEPVRGVIHVHTRRSDGSGTVDQIASAAARAGLHFVILTDHGDGSRAPEGPAYRAGVLCIDAVEVSTDDGHLLALGLAEKTPYPLGGEGRDVIEDVARLGGMSVAAHPGSRKPSLHWDDWSAPFDGIEWLNGDSEWRDERPAALVRAFFTYPFRKSETMTSLLDRPAGVLRSWDELTRNRQVVALAAADAHATMGIGGGSDPYGDRSPLALPGYEHMFRAFSVALPRLHLTGDARADALSVVAEIRAGRVYSSIEGLAAPARMAFTATSEGRTAEPGEVFVPAGPVVFDVRTTAPAASRVDLMKDGAVIASAGGGTLRFEASPPPGAYRVEVSLTTARGGGAPWLLSNPIYLGPFGSTPTPADPPVRETLMRYADGPVERGWGLEKNDRSDGALDVVRTVDGTRLSLRYALGGSEADGPYVALVMPAGPVVDYDRVMFSARASAPMRLRVQLRIRTKEGDHYWRKSVYLEDAPKEVSVRFDDMRLVGDAGYPHPLLAQADALMFMVDQANTALGAGGRLWFDDIRYGRTK